MNLYGNRKKIIRESENSNIKPSNFPHNATEIEPEPESEPEPEQESVPEPLIERTNKIQKICCTEKYHLKMETIFMNNENSKTNESNKFCYYFADKFSLKEPNKNTALVN